MDHTIEQVEDLMGYLNSCVKDGSMDEEVANEIIDNQDWDRAKAIREIGDSYANKNE
jgi:hypothetical protein